MGTHSQQLAGGTICSASFIAMFKQWLQPNPQVPITDPHLHYQNQGCHEPQVNGHIKPWSAFSGTFLQAPYVSYPMAGSSLWSVQETSSPAVLQITYTSSILRASLADTHTGQKKEKKCT